MAPAATLDNPIYQTLGKTFQLARIGAGVLPYSQGNAVSLELPNALLQKGITLRLSGNAVISVASATANFSEMPLGLIKNLRIIGDGRRVLFASPGRDLYRLAHFTWGKQWELSPSLLTVGTRPFSATIRIDHESLMNIDPVESLFDPRLYKKVVVEVTWGAVADIIQVGGATVQLSAVQMDVLVEQTNEGITKILFDHEVSADEQTVTATSRLFTFKVPQNGLLFGVMMRTDRDAGGGAGPVPVDDIINTVTLKSDTTVAHFDQVDWDTAQREMVARFQADGGATPGAQIPGYLYLPLTEMGMISSALNTNALNDLRLILDVTKTSGTEIVHVTYDWLVPRRTLGQTAVAA
jgi:hypothetical protein